MSEGNYTTQLWVQQKPDAVYEAILAVRDWWGGEIHGSAEHVGDEFTYQFQDFHFSRQVVTELVPGHKVVWHVPEGSINFVADRSEWNNTDVVFDITPKDGGAEVRVTHIGLVPEKECFANCSQGWNHYLANGLKTLIERPDLKAAS